MLAAALSLLIATTPEAQAGAPVDYGELRRQQADLTTEAWLRSLPPAPSAPLGFEVGKARHYKDVVERLLCNDNYSYPVATTTIPHPQG